MEFSRRKLPKESMANLFRLRIETVKPFALMLAPVYLWLKENEKFISIKGPLDFFTQKELDHLKAREYLYLPECTRSILPFRTAAHRVRDLLTLEGDKTESDSSIQFPEVSLAPAPFEISNEILRIIGPLWWEYPGQRVGVEPFLITVFVNELCDLIPSDLLFKVREQSMVNYERGLFRSSWTVFIALLLGYSDLKFLNQLRLRVFEENSVDEPVVSGVTEVDELIETAAASLSGADVKLIFSDFFDDRMDRISLKLVFRLQRIKKDFLQRGNQPPSVYGEGGFIDA